jgi:PAS domain S-box-containing protein
VTVDTTLQGLCGLSDYDEAARLSALASYGVLDTEREAAFDDIAEVAADIFEAPIAVVNFIADGRQWFKAEVGIGKRELPLDVSICRHAILQPGLFVIPDLLEDERFTSNPLVDVEGGLRFYGGALLQTAEGLPLGTVCVLDTEPRPAGITRAQERALRTLASQTMAQLELRKSRAALEASETRLRFLDSLAKATQPLTESVEIMTTTARILGEHLRVSLCAYADMDEDQDGFTIRGDWAAPGSRSIVGRYKLADFGKLAVSNLSVGLPLVINDNLQELAPDEAATFRNIGIAATICMPLVKAGRLTALMAVHSAGPRIWSPSELTLVAEATERAWAHIERARSEAVLRETMRRLDAILSNTRQAVFLMDENQHCTYANVAAEKLTGYGFAELQGRPLHEILHHTKPDGSHYPIEECPIDRAFPERAQMSGEELFVAADGRFYPVGFTASPVLDDTGKPVGTVIEARNITEEKRAKDHQQLLIDELNHRSKNLLAIVQGIVGQTFKRTDRTAREALEGRLAALAAAHSVLTQRNWEPAPLRQIVEDSVKPHAGPAAVRIEGPDLMLAPKTAVSMALAFHELATNAVKYGSLSRPSGVVDVRWHVEEERLKLTWQESGGPPVERPASRGFGSRMLERGLSAELEGRVDLEFAAAGLICTVDAPLSEAFR